MPAARDCLQALFDAALASADPQTCLARWLPEEPKGRTIIVGAGKAAASMARQLELEWSGPLQGLVIVPYGHAVTCDSIEVVEAAHPIPDESGLAATQEILRRVSGLTTEDNVICLLSGGGSSLLCAPRDGISLAEKQTINAKLLHSGAAIHEINAVRKKLSTIKGGRLGAACAPANLLSLLISDVPGNDAAFVASGPTVSDLGSSRDALEILDRYRINISAEVRAIIENSEPIMLPDSDVRILATSDDALLAAAAKAGELGIQTYSLGDVGGDARQLAAEHAKLALSIADGSGPLPAPCILLSGGETTVEVSGNGRGGRNGEYALALAIALDAHPQIHALAADTDGIDGNGDNAGCRVTPDSLQRAALLGLDPANCQAHNDSYAFFEKLDDLIVTGPTLTNVNDFRAILIEAAPAAS